MLCPLNSKNRSNQLAQTHLVPKEGKTEKDATDFEKKSTNLRTDGRGNQNRGGEILMRGININVLKTIVYKSS